MENKPKKYVSLICIVLFAMWLAHDRSYEPLIGLILSLAAFIWDDTKEYAKSKGKAAFNHDKKIYEDIVRAFEERDIINICKTINFKVPFSSQYGLNIIFVSEEYEPPIYEFWDKKLEKIRKDLFDSLDKLAHRVSLWTYPISNKRHTAIPDLYRGSLEELPSEIEDKIDEMYRLADEVANKYSIFYKEGGKKFDQGV